MNKQYSNFLKSDQYYDDIILQNFDNLDEYDLEKIELLDDIRKCNNLLNMIIEDVLKTITMM